MAGFSRDKAAPVATVVSVAVLVAATVAAFLVGSSSVSLGDLVAWATGGDVAASAKSILVNVRLPRVLAALLAGGALAVAGAIIQAVLDNPMASPNIIGINSGAGLAVLVAASVFPSALWLPPLAAFAGALATALVIFGISLGASTSRLTVVLAGIAITSVFGAGMNTILIVNPDAYIGSSSFLVGGLSGVLMGDLWWPALYIVAGLAAALVAAGKLNIMALGDDTAHALGMNVGAMRAWPSGVGRRAGGRGRELRRAARVRGAHRPAPRALLRGPRQPLGAAAFGRVRRGVRGAVRPSVPHHVRALRGAGGHPHGVSGRPLLHLPHPEEQEAGS